MRTPKLKMNGKMRIVLAPRPGAIVALVYLLPLLASLVSARPTFAQAAPVTAGVRLQAGIEKQEVDGDLKSAMEIYRKLSADTAAPRDIRAESLLRLAGCQEKLGAQARSVYEQIVRDYADQPAAVQARKRLASLKQQEHAAVPKTMSVRSIHAWDDGIGFGSGDTDGERAVYRVADMLYFGDLAGHGRKTVMKNLTRYGWVSSRDFSMVALNLLATTDRPHTLAVVKTDGTGYRELIRDDAQGSLLGESHSFFMGWSWDDRSLLLCDFWTKSEMMGRLWIVSVADGGRRELAHVEGERIRRAVFSPDGRFVAYEVIPKDPEPHPISRVFIVPTQGGESRLLYESAPWPTGEFVSAMKDWTPDGRFLAIGGILQGRPALYLLPMKDGAAAGAALFVRFGDFQGGDMTMAGALTYSEHALWPTNLDASLATFDSNGRVGSWRALELRAGRAGPLSFSPDGTQMSYTTRDTRGSLIVRDLATGQERDIYQSAHPNLYCQFSMRKLKVFCTEEREKGTTALISVDATSGAVEQLASFSGFRRLEQPPVDDKVFFLCAEVPGYQDTPVLRWDEETGEETVLVARFEGLHHEAPSLDGRWLLRWDFGFRLDIRPASGGEWRTLVSGLNATFMPPITTPDANGVLYAASDPGGTHRLFRVPVAGGEPQLVGNLPTYAWAGHLYLSLDGRKALALNAASRSDFWILENFEPSSRK